MGTWGLDSLGQAFPPWGTGLPTASAPSAERARSPAVRGPAQHLTHSGANKGGFHFWPQASNPAGPAQPLLSLGPQMRQRGQVPPLERWTSDLGEEASGGRDMPECTSESTGCVDGTWGGERSQRTLELGLEG